MQGGRGIRTAGITGASSVFINSEDNNAVEVNARGTGQLTLRGGATNSILMKSGNNDVAIFRDTGLSMQGTRGITASGLNVNEITINAPVISTIAVVNGGFSGPDLILTSAPGLRLGNGSFNVGPFAPTAGTTGAGAEYFGLYFAATNRSVTVTNDNTIRIPYSASAPKGATVVTTGPSQTIANCRLAAGTSITVPFPITLSTASIADTVYSASIGSHSIIGVAPGFSFRLQSATVTSSTVPNGTVFTNVTVQTTSGGGLAIAGCVLVVGHDTIYSNNVPVGLGGALTNSATYTVTISASSTITGSATPATSFSLSSGSITTSQVGLAIESPVISAGTLGGVYLAYGGLTAGGIVSLAGAASQNITAINTGTAGITTSGLTGGSGALNINSVADQPVNINARGNGALVLSGGNATNSIQLQANSAVIANVKSDGIEIVSGKKLLGQVDARLASGLGTVITDILTATDTASSFAVKTSALVTHSVPSVEVVNASTLNTGVYRYTLVYLQSDFNGNYGGAVTFHVIKTAGWTRISPITLVGADFVYYVIAGSGVDRVHTTDQVAAGSQTLVFREQFI